MIYGIAAPPGTTKTVGSSVDRYAEWLRRRSVHSFVLDPAVTTKFQNPYGACNFIVTWDGEDVREVLSAIRFAREAGDRFIQDKLIEYILNIPFRNPRPADIPAFVGKPVWAVDKHGRALVGMPGSETIIDVSELRELAHHTGPITSHPSSSS